MLTYFHFVSILEKQILMYRIKHVLFIFLFVIVSATESYSVQINSKAPEFTLPDISGSQVSLNSFKGKVVYVNFWASWCGPCKKEFPQLETLAGRYADKGVIILAINQDKKRSAMEQFLGKFPITSSNMIILTDPDSSVITSYGPRAMPSSYLLDKDGIVKYIHFGFGESDPPKWTNEIDALIK